ncbi:MAG: tetratricopeptide repeat protein, partial [Candidatus Zixiibacteriota bacterium]
LSEAIHEANLAVRLRPYDPIANMALIRTLFADSQLADEALSDSIAAAAVRTDYNIYLLNDVGAHLAAAGNLDRAGEILEWAIASRPPPVETDDFAFERKFVNSKANWKKEKAEAFYQLGYINGLQGTFDRSIEFSHKAIELDSSLANAYVNLANGYLATGQIAQARRIAAIAVEKFPDDGYVRQLQLRLR